MVNKCVRCGGDHSTNHALACTGRKQGIAEVEFAAALALALAQVSGSSAKENLMAEIRGNFPPGGPATTRLRKKAAERRLAQESALVSALSLAAQAALDSASTANRNAHVQDGSASTSSTMSKSAKRRRRRQEAKAAAAAAAYAAAQIRTQPSSPVSPDYSEIQQLRYDMEINELDGINYIVPAISSPAPGEPCSQPSSPPTFP